MTLEEEIEKLKKQLDDYISKNESFDKIYEISVKLDKLIAEYYKQKK